MLRNTTVNLSLFSSLFGKKKTGDELELIRFVISRFGYRPKNVELFQRAVTHKSFSNANDLQSNERLEFLGDAILDAIIADWLFTKFPQEDEGHLTKIKSKMVSRKTLSEIAEEMEMRNVLRYHKGRSINLGTLEGNAFEAMVGAIYLDDGYEAARKSIEHFVFRNYVDVNRVLEEEIDFKSKLFIWSQKNKLELEFNVISEENKGSSWEYKVQVVINEHNYGMGVGTSKKMAEQAAAKETLELMGVI